jgi:hypothetical protein
MKHFTVLLTAGVFVAVLFAGAGTAEAGGRHRGGGFFYESKTFVGYPAYGGTSIFVSSGSPGFSFVISSGPSYGYGRRFYGRHFRGSRYYDGFGYRRHAYRRHGHDRHFGRPFERHGGYRSRGGITVKGRHRVYVAPSVPQIRFWVPGRMTRGGYVKGYWGYR